MYNKNRAHLVFQKQNARYTIIKAPEPRRIPGSNLI